jgi:hypothetical protein
MSQQGQGTISQNDLMKKLVQAKKVMNKVDGGNYERGHVNENVLRSNPEDFMGEMPQQQMPVANTRPVSNGEVNISKIQNSKLPDAIKKAMIENPIQQISLNDTLDMDFLKGAKRLMEQEGVSTKSNKQQASQPKYIQAPAASIDMSALATLVENTVRKVLDEKLNQILTAQTTQSINENLVLKVGDSIFKGKITGVNKAK